MIILRGRGRIRESILVKVWDKLYKRWISSIDPNIEGNLIPLVSS